jgi:hypothetical protein
LAPFNFFVEAKAKLNSILVIGFKDPPEFKVENKNIGKNIIINKII